jgi:hypothetical protein
VAGLSQLQLVSKHTGERVHQGDVPQSATTDDLLLPRHGEHLVDRPGGIDHVGLLGGGPFGIIDLNLIGPAYHQQVRLGDGEAREGDVGDLAEWQVPLVRPGRCLFQREGVEVEVPPRGQDLGKQGVEWGAGGNYEGQRGGRRVRKLVGLGWRQGVGVVVELPKQLVNKYI